jgi:hypothetical protein
MEAPRPLKASSSVACGSAPDTSRSAARRIPPFIEVGDETMTTLRAHLPDAFSRDHRLPEHARPVLLGALGALAVVAAVALVPVARRPSLAPVPVADVVGETPPALVRSMVPISPTGTLDVPRENAPFDAADGERRLLAAGSLAAHKCGFHRDGAIFAVTLQPDGTVRSVTPMDHHMAGTPVGECLARSLSHVTARPFRGEDVTALAEIRDRFEASPQG